MEIRGEEAAVKDSDWTYRFLRARANSIEGGTTEILKNIIAERVLNLPKLAMNFDFTDDQQAIKRTAHDLLAQRFKPDTVRELAEGAQLRRRPLERAGRARLARYLHRARSTAARDSAPWSW